MSVPQTIPLVIVRVVIVTVVIVIVAIVTLVIVTLVVVTVVIVAVVIVTVVVVTVVIATVVIEKVFSKNNLNILTTKRILKGSVLRFSLYFLLNPQCQNIVTPPRLSLNFDTNLGPAAQNI